MTGSRGRCPDHGRLLRAQHARRRRDGRVPSGRSPMRYTTDIWPVIFPAAALFALVGAWLMVRRGEAFRAFLLSSATIGLLLVSGGVGLYPEPHHLDHRPGLQPDDLQRRGGRQHARRGADHRAHRDAVRAALHGRRLLHLPGQDRRRHARLLGRRRLAGAARARSATADRPSAACSRARPGARRAARASGSPAGSWRRRWWSSAAYLTSVVVAEVFLGGATLPTVAPPARRRSRSWRSCAPRSWSSATGWRSGRPTGSSGGSVPT